jgi:hypothetical protein
MTYGMLGSWGYSRSRTTAAVLVSGVWNSFLKLSLLVLALALVGLQGNASGARVTAALLGIGGLVTAVVVFALMLRSQEGAHRFGVLAGVASRLLRLVGRPSVDGWELSPVSQWMTKDPLTATPDTTTEEAAQLMLTKRVPPPPRLGGPEPHGDGQHPRRLGLRDPPTPNTGVDLQPGTEASRCW